MFIVTKQIDSENISKLCRTCLREDGEKMMCLFVGPAGSSLAAKLRSLSCLEIWQGDGLPEKLCERCITRAESALLFREQCRAADRALRQAALKVSRITTRTIISESKVDQHSLIFTPEQNSKERLKCGECGALFMNHQELCAHYRLHGPFINETTSLPHMHIVESHNTFLNAGSPNKSVIYNENASSIPHTRKTDVILQQASENGRSACALYCPLCNHTFPNRDQLINHNYSHDSKIVDMTCDNDTVEFNDNSNEIAKSSCFSCADDSAHLNETVNQSMTTPDAIAHEGSPLGAAISLETQNRLNSNAIPNSDVPTSIENNQNLRLESVQDKVVNGEISIETGIPSDEKTFSRVQTKKSRIISTPHVRKKYECENCGKMFTQKSKLITHGLFHSGEKPFKCENCDKAYASKSKLNAHKKLHSKIDVHRCDICGKTFSYPSYLLEHSKVHRTKPTRGVVIDIPVRAKFECATCNEQFRLRKNLKSHMKFHFGVGLFRCEICDKSFSEKYNLKVHLRSHKTVKMHECEYCAKAFNGKGNYIEHLRIHTKDKPFICKLCGKGFAQSGHLKSHDVSHNSVRPHQCRICGKRFKLISHLKRHTDSHAAIKKFECIECNQMFAQAFSLKRHSKRHRDGTVHR